MLQRFDGLARLLGSRCVVLVDVRGGGGVNMPAARALAAVPAVHRGERADCVSDGRMGVSRRERRAPLQRRVQLFVRRGAVPVSDAVVVELEQRVTDSLEQRRSIRDGEPERLRLGLGEP